MHIIRSVIGAAMLGLLGACAQFPAPSQPQIRQVASFDILTADAGQAVAALQRDGRVVLRGFNFASGSAELTPAGRFALERLGPALASPEAAGLTLAVVGHTDSTGNFDANIALSVARAEAIVSVLEGTYGIATDRIAAVGVGPIAPIGDNSTDEGRAENRRVELVLVE